MRFTALAVIAGALLMSAQAAPLAARNGKAVTAGASATLILPELTDITGLLSVNAIFSELRIVPANAISQVVGALSNPEQLVDVIANLPETVQEALADLPKQVQALPADVLAQISKLPTELPTLPAQLQTIVKDLPVVLQGQVLTLPNVLTQLPTLITSGDVTKKVEALVSSLPQKLTSQINAGHFDIALSQLQTVLGKVGGISALPVNLQQPLTLVQTTLIQVTQLTGNSKGVAGGLLGNVGSIATNLVGNVQGTLGSTVTTVLGLAGNVKNTVTVTVSQLHVVDGGLVNSVKDGVIAVPTQLIQGTVLETVATVTKGKLSQIPIASLINVQGLQVTQLTDKIALPLGLAKALNVV